MSNVRKVRRDIAKRLEKTARDVRHMVIMDEFPDEPYRAENNSFVNSFVDYKLRCIEARLKDIEKILETV